MKTFRNLFPSLCSYDNVLLAFKKARKRKTLKPYVIGFEQDLKNNLLQLRYELLFHAYRPKPIKIFILKDPKTRKIGKSEFRDRIVHHALCNIIEPILEKRFIYDSYANQKRKGTLAAIKRFDIFKRKVSRNFTTIKGSKKIKGFVLKSDVKQFFETVDHNILMNILKRAIKDEKVMRLIKIILANYNTKEKGKGMPLGNLTSQFFANVYLNELDQFVKHKLKAKYYLRYVDDFVILNRSREQLEIYKEKINRFLRKTLGLQLHPEKSKIVPLDNGTTFLGLRIFAYHKMLRKRNLRKFARKCAQLYMEYVRGLISYDKVYDFFEGWFAWSKHANTYRFRRSISKSFEEKFKHEISTKEVNRYLKTTNYL